MSNYLKLSNQNIELKKSIIDEIIAKLKIAGGFLPLISRVRIAVNENIGSVTYAEAITLKDDILTFKSVVLSIPYCDFVAESSTIITLNSYSNDLLLELLDNMPDKMKFLYKSISYSSYYHIIILSESIFNILFYLIT